MFFFNYMPGGGGRREVIIIRIVTKVFCTFHIYTMNLLTFSIYLFVFVFAFVDFFVFDFFNQKKMHAYLLLYRWQMQTYVMQFQIVYSGKEVHLQPRFPSSAPHWKPGSPDKYLCENNSLGCLFVFFPIA